MIMVSGYIVTTLSFFSFFFLASLAYCRRSSGALPFMGGIFPELVRALIPMLSKIAFLLIALRGSDIFHVLEREANLSQALPVPGAGVGASVANVAHLVSQG